MFRLRNQFRKRDELANDPRNRRIESLDAGRFPDCCGGMTAHPIVGGLIVALILGIFLSPTLYMWVAGERDMLPEAEVKAEESCTGP